jgi:nitroreductase
MMTDTLTLLHRRRSVKAADLTEPGPNPEQLDAILRAAHRVPDHGKIGPWRFIIFAGAARAQFGALLRQRYAEQNPDAGDKLLDFQAGLLLRAPLVIAVIASPVSDHKVPVWEQTLAVGAVCQNLLIATHAQGLAGNWLTEWYSYDSGIAQQLGLQASEQVAGFMYLGSPRQTPDERERPDLASRIHYWQSQP